MGTAARLGLTALVVAQLCASTGQGAVVLESLTVRVYDNAGILASDRTRAIKRANEILARANLAIAWYDCPAGAVRVKAICMSTPRRGELAVRLVRSPKDRLQDRALGSAVIDTSTGTGTLATVFVDRVKVAADQSGSDPWSMVGRVMAHEIGHLLLGTVAHGEPGLIRDMGAVKELARNWPSDWCRSPLFLP